MHLAGVGVGELAQLQIDDDQAAQAAVEEQEVNPEPLVADREALLAADKGEVTAQLEQKRFKVVD
jgi:hypothetical protein